MFVQSCPLTAAIATAMVLALDILDHHNGVAFRSCITVSWAAILGFFKPWRRLFGDYRFRAFAMNP
jgi:hypothetical protein